MYLLPSLILCFVTTTSCKSDKVLLKFKTDIDKVEESFGNLVFDMVEKIVDDVGVYQDYYTSGEVTTEHSVTKKILEGVENTTEEYETEETTLLKNSTQYNEILHNRLKRFAKENSSLAVNQSKEGNKPLSNSPVKNDTSCTQPKSGEALTVNQMNDLKEEMKKLYDLVILLKDQQKIISFLDNDTKNFDNDISSRFGVGDMLKILDYVNTKDMDQRNKYSTTKTDNDKNELTNIKSDLKEAISTLNQTKHVLTMERKKELLLEKELTNQKLDISFLKMMLGKLLNNKMGNTESEMLGAAQHLPKTLPVHRLIKPTLESTNLRRTFESEDTENGASDLDELKRLIHKVNQPKKNDIESKIAELQKKLDKKKRDDDALKQLKSLEKFLEHRKRQPNFEEESEIRKLFQLSTKTTDDGEGRALDDEIELELQKLQGAIDNLKENDDRFASNEDNRSDEERRQFQIMLKKMFNNQNKGKGYDAKKFQMMLDKMSEEEGKKGTMDEMVNQGGKYNVNSPIYREQNLLLREIMELRRQLANTEKSKFGGGYNYGYTDIYGQNPRQMNFPNERFKNSLPNYPPYTNPEYQNTRNQLFNVGSGPNQQYTNQEPSNYPKLTNAGFSPTYFNPASQEFKKALNGAPILNNQYNFDRNEYQSPFGPNNFNQGYQNLPKSEGFGLSAPPFRYNPETNAEFQPLTELSEIPFTISVLPSHKAFNLEANSADNAYEGGSHQHHQDTNQFFQKPTSEFFRPPEATAGSGAGQSGAYPQKAAENVGHAYQTMEDLKAQIYNLQSIIDGLSKPNYTQTLQDKETIAGLEKQISELKGVVNSINSDSLPRYAPLPPKADQNHVLSTLPTKTRVKKSIENNELDGDSQLYDQVVSGLKTLIFKKENEIPHKGNYDDLQNRIDELKYQLESRTHSKTGGYNPTLSLNNYQPPYYYQHNHFSHPAAPRHFEVSSTSKKNDVFTALVIKIVDKLIASTPAVLERLFGHGITELSNSEGNGENDVQKLFKSLGFFGYGPLIFLRLVDGFTTFVKILKRNAFFKNFLTPASVVLLVAGAVIFLVWWLQPNDEDVKLQSNGYYDKYNEQYSNYNYLSGGYGGNNNDFGYNKGSYTPTVYPRNYLQDDKLRNGFV